MVSEQTTQNPLQLASMLVQYEGVGNTNKYITNIGCNLSKAFVLHRTLLTVK